MEIEMFSHRLIERFLREQRLVYTVDADGDFHVDFRRAEPHPPMTAMLLVEGPGNEVFVVRATTPQYFEPEERCRAEQFVNDWNRRKRWPKAYTVIEPDGRIRVVGEQSWDLTSGIHAGLFEDITRSTLLAAFALFDALAAPLAPTADELETWLGQAS